MKEKSDKLFNGLLSSQNIAMSLLIISFGLANKKRKVARMLKFLFDNSLWDEVYYVYTVKIFLKEIRKQGNLFFP